jgi:tetratricopeptide (TPR) repeat protein
MAIDPYSSCPCNSGKKHKFCCMDISTEMEKIGQYLQNMQIKPAMKLLEKLYEEHPRRSWVVNNLASIFINTGRFEDAVGLLSDYIKVEPADGGARCLLAMSQFNLGGYEGAKKSIHQAIQKGAKSHPQILSWLLTNVAEQLWNESHELAARQHLALAMRFASDDAKQELFMKMLEYEGDGAVPYPLRGVHMLEAYTPAGTEEEAEYRKTMQMSMFGFFEEAASGVKKLLDHHQDSAALWQNYALLSAWDARDEEPARGFHEAAVRYRESDEKKALECEVLSQILQHRTGEERSVVGAAVYSVEKLSKLLSVLDDHPRMNRLELPPPPETGHHHAPVAGYHVFDGDFNSQSYEAGQDLSTLPTIIATILLIDADGDCHQHPELTLTARLGANLQDARTLLEAAAGDQLTIIPDSLNEQQTEDLPKLFGQIRRNVFYSPKTPGLVRLVAERQQVDHFVNNIWMYTEQKALNGKKPADLVGVAEMKLELTAAAIVLDVFAQSAGLIIDLRAVLEKLQLQAPEFSKLADESEINSLSFLQLIQLDLTTLNDEQLSRLFKRASLTRHHDLVKRMLLETMNRPEVYNQVDQGQFLHQLADMSRTEHDREGTLSYINKGKQWAKTQPKAFEAEMEWELRELVFRLDDPTDPELQPLLERINAIYIRKLPRLKGYLDSLLTSVGVTAPWNKGDLLGAGSTGGGLWTPEGQTAGAGAGGGKLWLPGQD